MLGEVKAFIDYQRERRNKFRVPHHIYIPKEDKVYKVEDEDIIDFLKEKGVSEAYLESAPIRWLYNILNNGFNVYTMRFKKLISEYRKKFNMRKSHSNDAKLLYMIHRENPKSFIEYHRRQLHDPLIQEYKATLRRMARIRQMMKNGYGEELSVAERKLVNKANKLYRHLRKKYKDLLERFPEFKGAYGNLLYFLSIIPEIKSFRSTRSFLRYLGLRNVERHYYWNREARQALVEIAYRLARRQGVKYRRKKPNWEFTRKVALTIYQRLRDGGG